MTTLDPEPYERADRALGWAQVDVLPLERFNAVWRPNEPERLKPVYVERVTIREALRGDLLPSLFGIVQLIEPTFGVRPGPVASGVCSSGSSPTRSMLVTHIKGALGNNGVLYALW